MLRKGLFGAVLALALLLSACNGLASTPTPTPVPACIVGLWEVASPEAFARQLLPPGSFDMDTLHFKGAAGAVGYAFSADGVLTVQALNWMGQFDVRDREILYALNLSMVGFASGAYTLEGDTLRVNEVKDSSGISFQAMMDQETMMDSINVQDFAPLFVAPFTVGRITCSETELRLEILNLPTAQEPLVFVRVKPKAT
ncbi:MAG: hypothetical protein AB1894_08495 [Chloroflexota bacterium]